MFFVKLGEFLLWVSNVAAGRMHLVTPRQVEKLVEGVGLHTYTLHGHTATDKNMLSFLYTLY